MEKWYNRIIVHHGNLCQSKNWLCIRIPSYTKKNHVAIVAINECQHRSPPSLLLFVAMEKSIFLFPELNEGFQILCRGLLLISRLYTWNNKYSYLPFAKFQANSWSIIEYLAKNYLPCIGGPYMTCNPMCNNRFSLLLWGHRDWLSMSLWNTLFHNRLQTHDNSTCQTYMYNWKFSYVHM